MSTPTLTLDQALAAVSNDEAVYTADSTTLSNIQAAIAQAQQPLAGAQAKIQTDIQQWISDLQTANQLISAKITSLQGLLPSAPVTTPPVEPASAV